MTDPRGDLLSSVAPDLRRSILLSLSCTDDVDTIRRVAMLLGDSDPGVAEAAEEALVRQASVRAALAASFRLYSRDASERARAMSALARLGDPAIGLLISLADSRDADLRKYAVDTLGLSRSKLPRVVAVLSALLEDPDLVIAGAAAEGLGNLAAKDAVPALAACLTRDDLWVRPAALDALGRIGDAASLAAIASVPPDGPGPVVAAAVHALAQLSPVDPAEACRGLAAFLDHSSPPIKEDALLAIGRILDDPNRKKDVVDPGVVLADVMAAAPAARLALTNSSPASRRAGALVLARTTVTSADLDALESMLRADVDPAVRGAALLALAAHGHLGPRELGNTAVDAAAPDVLRRAAIEAMAPGLDEVGERLLVGFVSDGRGTVEQDAAIVLARTGRQSSQMAAVTWLEQAWDDLDDPEAVASAMAVGSGVAAGLAIAVLDSRNEDMRGALFAAVLRPADARSMEEATQAVLRAVADDDRGVRAHAIRLIAGGVPGPFELAIRLAIHDSDARVRVRAIEALGAFPAAADDRTVLLMARTDASGWVRSAAIAAAASRGCCDVDTIVAAQLDDFAPVRHAALVAALELVPDGAESESADALLRIAVLAKFEDDPSMVELGRLLESRLS